MNRNCTMAFQGRRANLKRRPRKAIVRPPVPRHPTIDFQLPNTFASGQAKCLPAHDHVALDDFSSFFEVAARFMHVQPYSVNLVSR